MPAMVDRFKHQAQIAEKGLWAAPHRGAALGMEERYAPDEDLDQIRNKVIDVKALQLGHTARRVARGNIFRGRGTAILPYRSRTSGTNCRRILAACVPVRLDSRGTVRPRALAHLKRSTL